MIFLNKLIDKFKEHEYMYTKELFLHDVDAKYLPFLISYFYIKDMKVREKFMASLTK